MTSETIVDIIVSYINRNEYNIASELLIEIGRQKGGEIMVETINDVCDKITKDQIQKLISIFS
jgi:hypothetical protein